jgi:hypothetical protein
MRKLPWSNSQEPTRDIAGSLVCARRAVQRSNLIGRNNFSNADDFDHNTEFGHMCPQGIDHLSALPDQQIARAMLHQLTLLLGRFDPDKTHKRMKLAANVRHDSRVHLIAPLPSLIHDLGYGPINILPTGCVAAAAG